MAVTEDSVREALKLVIDPELFVNIVDLGLIYLVEVQEGGAAQGGEAKPAEQAVADGGAAQAAVAAETVAAEASAPEPTPAAEATSAEPASAEPKVHVKIEMTMTSPACPAGPQLISNAQKVVGALEGVGGVEVKMVMVPPWTPDRMTEDARDQLGIF